LCYNEMKDLFSGMERTTSGVRIDAV
jgi:hypothetical protein